MRGQDCGHRHYENNQSNAYAAHTLVVHEITRLKAPHFAPPCALLFVGSSFCGRL
jgi:hypothetical protein